MNRTTSPEIIGPYSSYYVSQRLKLHYVDWGNESAPPLLLIHGGNDHARNWDWVARELRESYHVIAPDLRGHGDSAWALGGQYTHHEYVLDITQLIETLELSPVKIIAHSMGGSVALQYASIYPERVAKLVAIEGLGAPPGLWEPKKQPPLWKRVDEWIQQVQGLAARNPRRYPSVDAAAARMQEENPHLSAEQAHHLTVHGVARNEDGTFTWKFDNYLHAYSPQRLSHEERKLLWSRITCPTLLVQGRESWASDPDKDGSIEVFQQAQSVTFEDAGHWVHHDQLDEFLRVVRAFLSD